MFPLLLVACTQGPWVDVAVSGTQVCAINTDGALRCTGKAPLPTDRRYTLLDGSTETYDHQLCGLDLDGAVVCDQADVPSEDGFEVLHLHAHTAAATGPSGSFCWYTDVNADASSSWCSTAPALDLAFPAHRNPPVAINLEGQLQDWDEDGSSLPPDIRSEVAHALNAQGEVYYALGSGALYLDQEYDYAVDITPEALTRIEVGRYTVDTGWLSHDLVDVICGLDLNQQIRCFEHADSTAGLAYVNDIPSGQFTDIDVGDNVACAVSVRGQLRCWGPNAPAEALF